MARDTIPRFAVKSRLGHAFPLEDQVKPSRISECLEVEVSGDKRYSAVDTALSDERVTKTRLALLCQHLSSQAARATPIARADVNQRQVRQSMRGRRGELRVTEQFAQDGGRHYDLAVPECLVEHLDIITAVAFKERDPCAGVGCDHRSALSSA